MTIAISAVIAVVWFNRPPSSRKQYWSFSLIFLFGFWSFAPVWVLGNFIPVSVSLPVTGGLEGLELDKFNNVYVGSPFGRIQKFDEKGNFQQGFLVDTAGGIYRFEVVEEKLTAYTARGNLIEEFSLDGQYLSRSTYEDADMDPSFFFDRPPNKVSNDAVAVAVEWVFDRITIEDRTSLEKQSVYPSFLLIPFFLHPFTGWLIAAIGVFGMAATGKRKPKWLT